MKKNKVNFEESMDRLSEIVDLMEKGGLDLDEMIKLFEEGVSLSKECDKILDTAESKIEKITKNVSEPEEVITTTLFDVIEED